jgi:hypothetical protein
MALFQELLSRPRCEVLINFMDSYVNRFCSVQRVSECIDLLYGSTNWTDALQPGLSSIERRDILLNSYMNNLNASSKLRFGMRDKQDRHIYHLIFASNHIKGLEVMKRSMASASQELDVFVFSEKHSMSMKKEVGHETTTAYKLYCTQKLNILFRSIFHSQKIKGEELVKYVLYETPFIFNYKNMMRKALKDCELVGNRKFDEILYYFDKPVTVSET